MIACTSSAAAVVASHDSHPANATVTSAGGTSLSWAMVEPVSSLDFASDPEIETVGTVMGLVAEPLERVSANSTYTPLLAKSFSQPNPTTLKYTLRSGVTFSDGQPLTAADVVWNIQHYGAKTASSASSLPAVKRVTASGSSVVLVKLAHADPIARAKIDLEVYVMEKKFAVAHAKTLGTASAPPIGTGPFVVSSDTSQSITLSRNPHYWGHYPAVSSITFPFILDNNALKLAVQAGTVDAGTITNLKSVDLWRKIPGATVDVAPSSTSDFIGFNVTDKPFDDVHVRRAIAYATDQAGLASAAFSNNVSKLNGMVPAYELSDVAGSQKAAQTFLSHLPQYKFNQAKAKSELAKSAYPSGFTTTVMVVSTTPWMQTLGLLLQQDLKPLGITVNLKTVTLNQWFTQFFQGKLTGMAFGSHFNALVNDPDGLLTYLVGKSGAYNLSKWSTPAVEKALTILQTSRSRTARWNAAKTILAGIAEDVPYIPMFTEPHPFVLGKSFKFSPASGIGLFDLANGSWIYHVKPANG